MDALRALAAAPVGLLPDARTRLIELTADLRRLQCETAWESDAARDYRASLDDLIEQVDRLHDDVALAEGDLRLARRTAAAAGAW